MLTLLSLKYFKCFKFLRLPLSPLTLLSGANASGKSSVLQSLVMLHQTIREHEWSTHLMLNGSAVQLGTVMDVVDKVNGRHLLEISIENKTTLCHWIFSGERSDMSMALDYVMAGGHESRNPKTLQYLLPVDSKADALSLSKQLEGLTYITAERVGPREFYTLQDSHITTVVGPCGEHAIGLLYLGQDNPVMDGLVLPDVPTTLLHQVRERMRKFFPGFALNVHPVQQANAVTLGLRTSDDMEFNRPIHAGFGITQILPIIIAGLSASEGDILLIENPEIHLHPAGQALAGQFLADIARAGVQVIVETHSDHVLNGIRRAVKAQRIPPEDVAVYFFRQRSVEAEQVLALSLDNSGNIDTWPDGFFDQFDKDMNHFADWEH